MDPHLQAVGFPHLFALVVTAICAITDARTGCIYNRVTYPAILVALAWHLAFGHRIGITSSLIGLAAGIVPFGLAAARGWIGGGDAKLFGAVGASLGALLLLDVLVVTFVLAALYGTLVLWRRDGARGAARRLGAGVTTVLRGRPIDMDADDSGPALRLGVFVFIGTLTAIGAIWLTR